MTTYLIRRDEVAKRLNVPVDTVYLRVAQNDSMVAVDVRLNGRDLTTEQVAIVRDYIHEVSQGGFHHVGTIDKGSSDHSN